MGCLFVGRGRKGVRGLNDMYLETGITDLSELHCVTMCGRQAVSAVWGRGVGR